MNAEQRRIKEIFRALHAPLVCHPGGWGDSLPDWIAGRAVRQRMEMLDNGGWDKATDADIAAHLFTASLVAPMDHDWAEIYIYTVAQLMPQLCDTTIPVPKELSAWQQQELNQLKRKIFERQNKGGLTMGTKVVLEEQPDGILVGVIRDNTDPVLKKVATAADSSLPQRMAAAAILVPAFIAEAEAKWKDSPRNPAYKAPAPEKKKPEAKAEEKKPEVKQPDPPKTEKKAEGKTSENQGELPLLAQTPPVEQTTTPAPPASTTAQPAPAPEPATVKEAIKAAIVEAGGNPIVDEEVVLNAMEKAGVEIPVGDEQEAGSVTKPPETVTKPHQSETFKLADGRGPFNSLQEAMDALGLDKNTRPQHNRYDRLSKKLQAQILKA